MNKRFWILLALLASITTQLCGQTVVGTLSRAGLQPYSVAVYETGNKIFVADNSTGNLYFYDGATNAELGSVFVGTTVYYMVVDEASGKLYAASNGAQKIAVVNAATGAFITYLAGTYTNTLFPNSLVSDQSLGKVYALSSEGLRQIDVATNSETTVPGVAGSGLLAMDLNPVTHEVFVAHFNSDVLDIVDGITLAKTTVAGLGGLAIGVNPAENKVYISRGGGVGVPFEVYDRDTGSINNVFADNDVSAFPFIHNPASNRMYTSSEVNAISSIIEGATEAFFNLPMFSSTIALEVRPATNHVYYATKQFIGVLDDPTQVFELIPVNNPSPSSIIVQAVAINQSTGRVYVINDGNALNFVTVVQDGDRLTRPPVHLGSVGFPAKLHVMDPASRQIVDTWTPPSAFQSDHAMATRPGGGRLYVPHISTFTEEMQIYAGAGSHVLLTKFSTGGNDSRAVAFKPDGSRFYVTNSGSDNVSVMDAANNTLVTTIAAGDMPWGIAASHDGTKIYIANQGSGVGGNSISVINTASNTVTNTIAVGTAPHGVAINPSGTRLFVANSNSGTVSVIDLSSETVVTAVTVGTTPHWLACTPDGKRVYVGNRGSGSVSIIDAGTNTVIQTLTGFTNPEGIGVMPDNSEVFVVNSSTGTSSVSVINNTDFSITNFPLPSDAKTTISLTIEDPSAKFAGRVTSSGVPISGALVRALQGGVAKGTATTNANGDYAVFNLLAGTYDIEASASGYVTQTQFSQTVALGRITVVDFNLNPIDATPPPAPINLAATPSSWTNVNSFSIDWTNPSDPSGIAAAWYKVGSVPNSSTDGTRTTNKPFTASAAAQGGQTIYVWLEDGAGNKDHNNRSNTTLFWDATAPTGTISINGGASTTTSLIVTLDLSAADGMSGMGAGAQVRFSNDNSTWSPAEAFSATKSNWDLSTFGGNTNAGTKTVYVQFKDVAGNWSSSFSDDILYSPTQTFTFNPTDDAYVRSDQPNNNFGTAPTLRMKQSSPIYNSYLKFAVSGVSGQILSAKLRMKVTVASSSGGSVYSVSNNYKNTSNPWIETGIKYNNAPAISGSPLDTEGAVTVNQVVEFDVTLAITGNGTFSFGLKNSSTTMVQYSSKQGATKPELVIQTGSPSPPTIVSFSPTSGPVGAVVIITGTNFSGATQVAFNGVVAGFTVDSNTQISATVPSGAATGKISVTTPGGSVTSANDFTVTPPPIIFNPTDDAYVRADQAGSNFGTQTTLRMKQSAPIINSYLKFVVSGVSGTVISAKLRMKVTAASSSGGSVYSVSNNQQGGAPWTELNVTYSNAPIISGPALDMEGAVTVNQVVEFDVTPAIAGNGTFSFGLNNASTTMVQYSSKEGATKPELVIQTGASAAKMANLNAEEVRLENAEAALPEKFALAQNYPNPFNAQTIIEYALPEAVGVRLVIYNVLGQLVRKLVDENQSAGYKRVLWDGRNELGAEVGTGVYFLQLNIGRQKFVRKMFLQQ